MDFPLPKGPKGRFDPTGYYYWGIWKFSQNISAAKAYWLSCQPAPPGKARRRRPWL